MPFTLAHAAAALPFRRFRLVPSALLIGTLAPDFEYFVRLSPDDGFGHTLLGTFILTLPLALLVLWIFHNFVKLPLTRLLPYSIERRLANRLPEFRFGGAARFSLIVGCVLLGIATHLLWDSFTHPNTWPYLHFLFLRQAVHLPIVGVIPCYNVLQHGSTIVGIGILSAWLGYWYRTTAPSTLVVPASVSSTEKIAITAVLMSVALLGAIIRAVGANGIPTGWLAQKQFISDVVVTTVALLWWQLVAYGVFISNHPSAAKPDGPSFRPV